MAGDCLSILELHPPVGYPDWLWWSTVGLGVGALVVLGVGLLCWSRLRRTASDAEVDPLDGLRRSTVHDIDALAGGPADAAAARELGRLVRAFVSIASHVPIDAVSAAQLRIVAVKDPRFEPASRLVAALEPAAFGGATFDVAASAAQAREVVEAWS